MAYFARSTTTSDGVTGQTAVPFPYLAQDDIQVFVDGAAFMGSIEWNAPTLITLTPIPASGVEKTVQRVTPLEVADRAIPFMHQRGSIASEQLNINNTAALYRDQEQTDALTELFARALLVAPGATVPNPQDVIDAATAVGDRLRTNLSNIIDGALGASLVTVASADTPVSLAVLLGLRIQLEMFGGLSNVFTAAQGNINASALTKAMALGLDLEGFNRVYALNGEWITASQINRMSNIRFRQVGAVFAGSTLAFVGKAEVSLTNVEVDLNNLQQTGGFNNSSGIRIQTVALVNVDRTIVRRGGAVTGIQITACDFVTVTDSYALDFAPSSVSMPSDDVCQGISIIQCPDVKLFRSGGKRLRATGAWANGLSRFFSRGLTLSAMTYATIDTPIGEGCDQGVDLTGSADNRGVTVINALTKDCYFYGLKLSNHTAYISVIGGQHIRPGKTGVIVEQANEMVGQATSYLDIQNVSVLDAGAGGYHTAPRCGFRLQGAGSGPAGAPYGVRLINCQSIDTQVSKTTDFGALVSDVVAQSPQSTIPLNRLINFRSVGHITAAQQGFDFPRSEARGTSTVSVPNDTSPGTAVVFAVSDYDPANLHDPTGVAVPASRIYAKVSGVYLAETTLLYTANATGWRSARFAVNGSFTNAPVPETTGNLGGGESVPVTCTRSLRLNAGDYVEVFPLQNSGGALNINLANSRFNLTLLSEGF